MSYYRHPSTRPERREASNDGDGSRFGAVKIRRRRLPTDWSDKPFGSDKRSWKSHRRTKYRTK